MQVIQPIEQCPGRSRSGHRLFISIQTKLIEYLNNGRIVYQSFMSMSINGLLYRSHPVLGIYTFPVDHMRSIFDGRRSRIRVLEDDGRLSVVEAG